MALFCSEDMSLLSSAVAPTRRKTPRGQDESPQEKAFATRRRGSAASVCSMDVENRLLAAGIHTTSAGERVRERRETRRRYPASCGFPREGRPGGTPAAVARTGSTPSRSRGVGFVNSIRLQIQQIYAGTEFVHPTGDRALTPSAT